jgi:cytoskeleton protein RodZ
MIVVGGWLLIENLFIDTPDTALVPPPSIVNPPLETPALPESWESGSIPPATDFDAPLTGDTATSPLTADPAETAEPQVPSVSQPTIIASEPAKPTVTTPALKPAQDLVPEKPVVTNAQIGDDRLGLTFDGVSWIEVLDANGARLVYGLFDAQVQPLSVQGQAPFDVTIGDANHVDILVNGQVVSSEPYMRRNNSARFKVEASAASQ